MYRVITLNLATCGRCRPDPAPDAIHGLWRGVGAPLDTFAEIGEVPEPKEGS